MGLKAYHEEYNRFPSEAISPTPSQTRGKILKTLHPEYDAAGHPKKIPEGNPRGINFFDPPAAKNKMSGMYYDDKNEPVLVDPWGTPFYFMASPDERKEVPNPDLQERPRDPKVQTDIIIYSAGPDRNPDTWRDNIASWR